MYLFICEKKNHTGVYNSSLEIIMYSSIYSVLLLDMITQTQPRIVQEYKSSQSSVYPSQSTFKQNRVKNYHLKITERNASLNFHYFGTCFSKSEHTGYQRSDAQQHPVRPPYILIRTKTELREQSTYHNLHCKHSFTWYVHTYTLIATMHIPIIGKKNIYIKISFRKINSLILRDNVRPQEALFLHVIAPVYHSFSQPGRKR